MLAEQVIAAEIKFLGNLTVVESNMTAGNPVIAKPARWHKTVSMNITIDGKRQPILLRPYEYCREYWPDDTQTDIPKFFADKLCYPHWHSSLKPLPIDRPAPTWRLRQPA